LFQLRGIGHAALRDSGVAAAASTGFGECGFQRFAGIDSGILRNRE
jgi:hypothetical protein